MLHDEQNESLSPEEPVAEAAATADAVAEAADQVVDEIVDEIVDGIAGGVADQIAGAKPDASADSAAASSAAREPVVAKLTSARMPADFGISSLGLILQLGGVLGIVVAALFGASMAISGTSNISGALFLVAVLSGTRSAFLRSAGTSLLYGTGRDPANSVRNYLYVAFAQSAISLVILNSYVDTETTLKLAAFFLSWPLAMLAFFGQRKVKELIADGVPQVEDYGFEGAAVLMTLFGIMGTLFAALILEEQLDDAAAAFSTPASGILVLIIITLFGRSIVHTLAGLKGISGANFEECNASAAHYYNFGIVSSICIGVTLFIVVLMTAQNMMAALVLGGVTTPLLLTWPHILRRLYAERNFHVYLEGSEAQTFQRAPDAGLIALGWTLVAVSLFSLGFGLVEAIYHEPLTAMELDLLLATAGPDAVDHLTRSPWWSVGVGGLQLWAGIELIRMSERHKLAAMLYGLVSVGVVLYLVWPAMDSLDEVFTMSQMFGKSSLQEAKILVTGLPLILAVGTMVLVNRVTVPAAVIHQRKPVRTKVPAQAL